MLGTNSTNVHNIADESSADIRDTTVHAVPTPATKKDPTLSIIFIQGAQNINELHRLIMLCIEESKFWSKCFANDTVKVNVKAVADFRALVKHRKEYKVKHYIYQVKSEGLFKVLIRHLHHLLLPDEIKDALSKEGFLVRNVANIRHWKTKDPLPLFFTNLDPDENSKEFYKLKTILHTRIKVETPKPCHDLLQCRRCQQFGHTQTYCTLPFCTLNVVE